MFALSPISIGSILPLSAAAPLLAIPALLLLVLCIAAAIGTIMLLPGRHEPAIRKLGGILLLAVLLVFIAWILRQVSGAGAPEVYFWIFSVIAIIAAIRVVSHPRPVYSALYFVLTVVATAGLFVLLWAEFMAAALVLIYAGAILVTYVFVIMLAQEAAGGTVVERGMGPEYDRTSREPVIAAVVGYAVMGITLFLIFDRPAGLPPPVNAEQLAHQASPQSAGAEDGTISQLARYLFTRQAITLEVAGLLLTIGMVGAVIIARRRVAGVVPVHERALTAGAAPTDVVQFPATPINDNPHSIPVYGTENPEAKRYPEA